MKPLALAFGLLCFVGCGEDSSSPDGMSATGDGMSATGDGMSATGDDLSATGDDLSTTGDDMSATSDASTPPDFSPGGPVGTCDPNCTGTKMCDDAGACVCAPGWVASGTDCVAAPVTAPAMRTKAEVCARYAADTAAVSPLWKAGAGGACDPGTVPYAAQVAALRYLNFYRWMIGVGPVQVVPSVAQVEQECAKILQYSFSHSPASSTMCYTMQGAAACGASLIASGFSLVTQFDGYALEIDQNLIHRRNVLAVGRAGVWAGTNGAFFGTADMHYGGAYPALSSDPEIVAHPGPGPNVRTKVPNRWFVQKGTKDIPAVDARVYVVATNEQKPMKRYHHYANFSSFDLDNWTPALDTPYRVELVDDTNAVIATYETTFVSCP